MTEDATRTRPRLSITVERAVYELLMAEVRRGGGEVQLSRLVNRLLRHALRNPPPRR